MRRAIREAADLVLDAVEKTLSSKQVTYDIHRQIEGGEEIATSEFAEAIAENIEELAQASSSSGQIPMGSDNIREIAWVDALNRQTLLTSDDTETLS